MFTETRALAQEWTYRFLAAALHQVATHHEAGPMPEALPTTATVRAWALAEGLPVSDRGRLKPEIWAAFASRHGRDPAE